MSGIAFRNSLRKLAYNIRSIPGKQFGWRNHTVTVETRTYLGVERGQGSKLVTSTPITEAHGQPPKVRFLSDEEVALGGENKAIVEVGPITPDFGGGGTAFATLYPTLPDNTILNYVIEGPDGIARYRLVDVKTDKAGHYMVRLDRTSDGPT